MTSIKHIHVIVMWL